MSKITSRHAYLIGVDSDGCVFDNMTIKHQQCFGPAFLDHYGLNAIAEPATKLWDFVNLFGRTRGCNRFCGVVNTIQWLEKISLPEIQLPSVEKLAFWVKHSGQLSNQALEDYRKLHPDAEFDRALEWSNDVNRRIAALQREIPPISGVKEALGNALVHADVIVVSQAPSATIQQEWHKYGLDNGLAQVCGQEYGSKSEQLRTASNGCYPENQVLLIGDAPGDYTAAKDCGALFYPIVPGQESTSWETFRKEALPRFLAGKYAGEYQSLLVHRFESALPESPELPFQKF